MNTHPSEDILGTAGQELSGRRIVLCLTGSVAVVRAVELARLLMRHGAEVYPVMTASAARLIGPDLLEWATGHRPVLELSGAIEHVALAGNVERPADLILVAPATANTVGKIAAGIDDTPVTTFVTTGMGQGLPLVLVPAMHLSMYDHPLVRENLAKLGRLGVTILMPRLEEGKAKIATEEEILQAVIERLFAVKPPFAQPDWEGKTVLVTAGRTAEPLDTVRTLSNNSSGRMAVALAQAALERGAKVLLVAGKLAVAIPQGAEVFVADTAQAMYETCQRLLTTRSVTVMLAAAAVGDWQVENPAPYKVPADHKWTLTLVPTLKIIDQVKTWSPATFLCAFRAQTGLTSEQLGQDAVQRLRKARADLIAANDTGKPGTGFEALDNAFQVWGTEGLVADLPREDKRGIADKLLDIILKRL